MRDVGSAATPIMATFPMKRRPPSEGTVISAGAPCRTFPISASGTPTRTLAGLSSAIENTTEPADTVCPGSTFRMLMLPEMGATRRVSLSRFCSSLAWASAACACAVAAARSSLRVPSCAMVIALARVFVCRLELLKVVRGKTFSIDEQLHALVFVFRTFEIDAGLFEFLFPGAGIGFLLGGLGGLLLRRRGVEGVSVIRRFDFRQQLSFTYVLALFDYTLATRPPT